MNPEETIKEDQVDTEAILPNAISYSYYVTLTTTSPLPYNSVEAILSLTIPTVQAGELLRILGNVRLHSANDLTGYLGAIVYNAADENVSDNLYLLMLNSDGNTDTYMTMPTIGGASCRDSVGKEGMIQGGDVT